MPDRTTQSHVLFSSAARTANANSESFSVADKSSAEVAVSVTAISGTSPRMSLHVEQKGSDAASVWVPHPDGTFGDITDAVSTIELTRQLKNLSSNLRLVAVISGTTPSFTFSAILSAKN